MKTLFAALLLAFAGSASAASVAMKPPVGITGNPAMSTGWSTASNFVGNFSAASFSGGFTTNVGGKTVTMPASMRMAANAGRFAVSAVRLSPAALIGSAVVAWLLSQGIEYVDGQFQKKDSSDNGAPESGHMWYHNGYDTACTAVTPCTWEAVKTDFETKYGSNYPQTYGGARISGPCYANGTRKYSCPFEYYYKPHSAWYNGGSVTFEWLGTAEPKYVPATEADFAPLATAPLPDAVADELAPKGVALPMENPVFDPPYVDEPLGEPYVDPVTGKRYQDNVRVTPQADGKTADVQTHKQEVDEEGDPATDPTTGVEAPPEKQDDFCKKNPEASSCKPFDEPPDLELEKKENPFSLNPVSGFGADSASCPAPQNLFTVGGQAVAWDWGNFCKFAQGIRPLIIGFAWLTAIMIVVSVGRRNG